MAKHGRKKQGKIPKVPKAAKGATAVEKADVAVAAAVAPYSRIPIVAALGRVGKLGDQPPLLALSGAVLVAGLLTANRKLARTGARMAGAHLLATAAKNLVKHHVDRTRPHLLVDEGRYRMEPGEDRSKAVTSFPSGHSAGAVAVARAFAREYPQHAAGAYGAAAVIAGAQVLRRAHYPTDVLAGTAIGLGAEALLSGAAKKAGITTS